MARICVSSSLAATQYTAAAGSSSVGGNSQTTRNFRDSSAITSRMLQLWRCTRSSGSAGAGASAGSARAALSAGASVSTASPSLSRASSAATMAAPPSTGSASTATTRAPGLSAWPPLGDSATSVTVPSPSKLTPQPASPRWISTRSERLGLGGCCRVAISTSVPPSSARSSSRSVHDVAMRSTTGDTSAKQETDE